MTYEHTAEVRRMEQPGIKPGEVWKVWWECTACAHVTHPLASFCSNCGARLLGVKA